MKHAVRLFIILAFSIGALLFFSHLLRGKKSDTCACAINCMDGRAQDAVKDYIKEHYGVQYVDMVTEAGPDKILAEKTDQPVVENIKKRVGISIHHHHSKLIFIVGHAGCAGNPVSKEEHLAQLREDKKTIESFGFGVEVVLLWVDENWKANKID